MERITKTLFILLVTACLLSAAGRLPTGALAEQGPYVLTYPDGSTVTAADWPEAKRLMGEWKLLYSGTTDESGNIALEGWEDQGALLIRESKVPDSYTADSTETEADLSDGSVTIVNYKSPGTGDSAHLPLWTAVLLISGALLAATGIAGRKQRTGEQ